MIRLERPFLSPSEIILLGFSSIFFLGFQFFLLQNGYGLIQTLLLLVVFLLGSILWTITAAIHSKGSTARVLALSIAFFILFSGALQKVLYFLHPNIRLYQISALTNLAGYMCLLYGISKMISLRWFAAAGNRSVKIILVFLPLFTLYLAQQSPLLLSYVAFDLICFFLASISVLLFPRGLPNDVLASIQISAIPAMISDFMRYGRRTYASFSVLRPFEEVISSFSFILITFLAFFYLEKIRGLKEVIELVEAG